MFSPHDSHLLAHVFATGTLRLVWKGQNPWLQVSLDPGLLVVQVPEELVQAVGLAQPGAAATRQALDLGEAPVDSVALLLHLRGVEGVAGHQTVSLAVQVLQTVL